jgi:hypothetical protein
VQEAKGISQGVLTCNATTFSVPDTINEQLADWAERTAAEMTAELDREPA